MAQRKCKISVAQLGLGCGEGASWRVVDGWAGLGWGGEGRGEQNCRGLDGSSPGRTVSRIEEKVVMAHMV